MFITSTDFKKWADCRSQLIFDRIIHCAISVTAFTFRAHTLGRGRGESLCESVREVWLPWDTSPLPSPPNPSLHLLSSALPTPCLPHLTFSLAKFTPPRPCPRGASLPILCWDRSWGTECFRIFMNIVIVMLFSFFSFINLIWNKWEWTENS